MSHMDISVDEHNRINHEERNMKTSLKVLLFFLVSLFAVTSVCGIDFDIGERVLAYWEDSSLYYVGTTVEYDSTIKGGGYHIVFADGDQDVIPITRIKPFDLKVGSKVLALWSDGNLYNGTIHKILGDAVYIHFDDGDKGWTSWAGIAVEP
jgi:hypothetical protein